MNILVLGNGGREHALCWKIKQSPNCKNLYCIPGNGGISSIATCLEIDPKKKSVIYKFCIKYLIDLVVIGPETYLEQGLSDYLIKKNIAVFGPSKQASKLETSKVFSKQFMKKFDIPTAQYKKFNNFEKAKQFINNKRGPYVIKVSGLAAGKGVIISSKPDEATKICYEILIKKKFGNSGNQILIEEYLEGFEISYFIYIDKKKYLPIDYALDHKKLFDGNKGPNTGGMGAFTPSNKINSKIKKKIIEEIVDPTFQGLKKSNITYRGVLFLGLMITKNGPKVIEYNVRFGDPECQVIMRRYKSDIIEDFKNVSNDKLNLSKLKQSSKPCLCVVLTSKGYPLKFKKKIPINNLNKISNEDDIEIFHSGTNKVMDKIYSSGGRVLSITAMSKNLNIARKKVYGMLKKLKWENGFFRKDIGK